MRELRKIEKAVKQYKMLLIRNQEEAKRNKKKYLEDLENLMKFIDVYKEDISEKFQIWCNTSVRVFESPTSNVFLEIKRNIDMKIVNHYLNKFSYSLSKVDILKRELKTIRQRFIQYQYFT